MTFYRRATVYLAMGKSKQALPDLDQVLQLKPDFTAVNIVIRMRLWNFKTNKTNYLC